MAAGRPGVRLRTRDGLRGLERRDVPLRTIALRWAKATPWGREARFRFPHALAEVACGGDHAHQPAPSRVQQERITQVAIAHDSPVRVHDKLYINAESGGPVGDETLEVIDAATEAVIGSVPMGVRTTSTARCAPPFGLRRLVGDVPEGAGRVADADRRRAHRAFGRDRRAHLARGWYALRDLKGPI